MIEKTKAVLLRLAKDDKGVTVIEYAVIGALVLVLSLAMIQAAGQGVLAFWTSIANAL